MKKRLKNIASVFMAMTLMVTSLPLNALAADTVSPTTVSGDKKTVTASEVGKIKNVTSNMSLTGSYDKLCLRPLSGSLDFTWPDTAKYVDVVFIQDFSGSFDSTISKVGSAVNNIIGGLDMGKDVDGTSPKDRVMFTTFQGSQGGARVNSNGGVVYNDNVYSYKIDNWTSGGNYLISDKNTVMSAVTKFYNPEYTEGGTPTVDGMRMAQETYQKATNTTNVYDNKSYTLANGATRQRETIYVLVTDGAANTAKWSNIPDSTKTKFNFYGGTSSPLIPGNIQSGTWSSVTEYDGYSIEVSNVDNSLARRRTSTYPYYEYYYGGYYYNNGYYRYYYKGDVYTPADPNKSYLWSDVRNSPDGDIYYGSSYTRTENYGVMLDAMKVISNELKNDGGLDKENATMVTAFWEDLNPNTGLASTDSGYSTGWYNMRTNIMGAMTDMASQPSYFATSSNITEFTNKLIQTFKDANKSSLETVKFNLNKSLIPGTDYKLIKKGDNPATPYITETEYEVRPGSGTKIDGSSLTVDMTNFPAGDYRIVYSATENEFMPQSYNPISNVEFTFDNVTSALNTSAITTEANQKTDCDIDIKKYVASNKDDYANGHTYKELEKRRQPFYFDTAYTFTGKVQEVNNTMVLKDAIDPRLDILDVYLVSPNGQVGVDIVSGATPNNTLVAEMKGGESGDISGVPSITVNKNTNTIEYSLPKQPKTIDGKVYPFGGYEGKEYVLVVRSQIKSTVSDAEIEKMINTPNPKDGRPEGVPNTSEISTDGDIKYSNEVRVVPPTLQEPNIKKFIAKIPAGSDATDWKEGYEILANSAEKYRHKIELNMPLDTTGYESLVVNDPLDEFLNYDANSVKAYYIKKDGNKVDIPAENLTKSIDSNNKVVYTIKETSTSTNLFEDMSEGKVVFEFDVQIKDGVNLLQRYVNENSRYEINNTSSYSLNGRDPKPSNEVKAIIPAPAITLTKFGKLKDDNGNRLPLSGAKFELKETTNSEQPRTFDTDISGKINVSNLTPGKTYTLTEISAPEGYVADKTPWTIVVNADNTVSITGGPTNHDLNNVISNVDKSIKINNNGPTSPAPEKLLHGSEDSDSNFKKPTMDQPYVLKRNGENITYQIKVPINSVEGYKTLKIEDDFDKYLNIDINSAKAYTESGGVNTNVSGYFSVKDGNTLTWEKTNAFSEIENKTLIIEVNAKILSDVGKIFEDTSTSYYPLGKISNKAGLILNDEPKVETNEVVVQLTKAEVKLAKLIKNTGADDSTAVPLTDGLSASFMLYKLRDASESEPNPTPDNTKDKILGTYIVEGPNELKIPILDTGTYYFLETSAPQGYAPMKGPIPTGLIKVPNNQGGVINITDTIKPINEKTTTPTIDKKIRSVNSGNTYSKNDLKIDIGESWQYAIDVPMPAPIDTSKDYTITDSIPSIFQINGLRVQLGDGTSFTDNEELTKLLKQNVDFSNPNNIKLVIAGSNINALQLEGKVIRIEVDTKVKPGTNILESGLLKNGVVPNTAYLEFGGVKLDSTVNVKPTVLRNFEFTKNLGSTPMAGATFKLYKKNPGGDVSIEPAKDPFTGQDLTATSNDKGTVSFKNVPAGDYIMRETVSNGAFPLYDEIWVSLSDSGTTDENSVVFRTITGVILSNNTVVNNELTTISGKKIWDDEDNRYNNRADHITVKLYRYGKAEDPETKQLVETRVVKSPWTYEFKDTVVDGQMTHKYPKYDEHGHEYIYQVDEEPVQAYSRVTEGVTGYDLKNKIDQVPLNIIKKDENGAPLSGRKFIIRNENGNEREHITDQNGILSIPDLTKGESYTLREVFSSDDQYLEINTNFYIEIDFDGNIKIHGLSKVPVSVDLDNNPATNDFAFEIINHKKPNPIKKVGPADGNVPNLELYDMKTSTEYVTYSITNDKISLQGIEKITLSDTVDPAMAVRPGTGKIIAISDDNTEEDVTYIFNREISNVGRTITFTTGNNYIDYNKLNGKRLRYTFDAYIAVNPDKLKNLHPDLTIPNTAKITFNDNPKTETETNSVNIKTEMTNLSLIKKVQNIGENGEMISEALPNGTSATFDLYDADTGKRLTSYTTDESGRISMPNFDIRKYFLREVKSPEGYNKVDDIYFNVVRNEAKGKLEVELLDSKDGVVIKTIQENENTHEISLGDVVDPIPDMPKLNKMIKGHDDNLVPEDEATPQGENKEYSIPKWDSKFDYVVDIVVPNDVKEINKIEFTDTLPSGLIMYDASAVKKEVGTDSGSKFVAEPLFQGADIQSDFGISNSGEYVANISTGNRYTIDRIAGKTVRLTIPVMIDPSKKLLSELDLSDGKLVNTGNLKINDKFNIHSTANATPPKLYGADFVKMSPDGHLLKEATFKLQQHTNAEGVPDGPAIPEDYRTDYISRDNGVFIMDKRLPAGKYFLTEHYLPGGWTDENGINHWATFTAASYNYTIEFVTEQKKDQQGTPITDAQGKPVMVDLVKLYERTIVTQPDGNKEFGPEKLIGTYDGTVSNPVKILNLQTLVIPVIKSWNDNNNVDQTRPKTLNFLLQRSIVNGQPDDIDPNTGKLVPKEGDAADTTDDEFNNFAKEHDVYNKTVETSSGNTQEILFSSDTYLTFGDNNHLNILRTASDGKSYNYYVVESGTDGYKSSYSVQPVPNNDVNNVDEAATDIINITNALKKTDLKINKVDDSNPENPVGGAKFNLSYESNGSTVVKTLQTETNGQLDLSPAIYPNKVYKLKEIEAPTGYLKNPTEYTIVTDTNNIPTVYSKYVGPGDAGNVVAPEFKSTVDTAVEPNVTRYTLKVVDNKTTTPTPEKKVNGQNSYTLESLSKDFEYSVEIPVTSVEGYKSFVLEDTVNNLLDIVPGSAKITADGNDISTKGTVDIANKNIKFTMTDNFADIQNKKVKLVFRAKVANGVTLDQLKQYVAIPENNAGIENTAKLTINDKPANSNTVHVIPNDPGTPPEVTKTVNSVKDYDLKTNDEIFKYKVEAKVPTNVLGYASLSLTDTLSKVLEVSGGVKLSAVDSDGVIVPLTESKDYVLTNTTNNDPKATSDGVITAKFVDGYDYTKLAGKTIVMEFSSKIKTGVTQDQLAQYETGIPFFKDIKIPNTANILLNDKPGTESKVTVTPPTDPQVEKGALDEAGNLQPESIKLQKEQIERATQAAALKPITFTIDAYVPVNTSGYNKFVISDQLKEVLKYKNATVSVEGVTDTSDIVIAESNGFVTATITGETNVAKYAGKKIRLSINTEIDTTKNISEYVIEDKINNTATIEVNDSPKVKNDVNLIVPKGSLEITKTLDGATQWLDGQKAVFKLERYIDGKLVTVNDNIEITSLNPVTINDLVLGNYKLTEISAPAGYQVASPKDILIDPNTTATQKISINDTKTPVQEKKVDKSFFEDYSNERTFTITTPVNSVDGINNLLIEDTLDNYFKLVDGSLNTEIVKTDGTTTDPAIAATNSGQKISLNINTPEALAKVKDSKIVITYKVTLKDSNGGVFIYENLPEEYKKTGIPNASTISVNNNPSVSTQPVKVNVPVGNVSLIKTADGAALPEGTSATFALYKKATVSTQPDTLLRTYSTSKENGTDKISVNNLEPGQYYFKETSAPAGYVLNDTNRNFEILVNEAGATSTVAGEGFTGFTVNNTKSDIPTPEKTVNDKQHLDLNSVQDTFHYKVEVPVTKVDGWTEFTLTDPVDSQLTIDTNTVKVNIQSPDGSTAAVTPDNIGADGQFTTENNLITFKYTNLDKVKALVGKTVVLTFDAKITNITDFVKAHPDSIVGNTANLNVGNGGTSSNRVTVTPPGETPTPVKTVNGRDSLILGKKDQRFFYDIRAQIPTNVTGYESLTLSDKLKDVLETTPERVTVYVNDIVNDDLKAKFLSVNNQDVVFKIDNSTQDPDFDFKTLAGKTLRIGIEADIKDSATDEQLAIFKTPQGDVQVTNDSTLTINNNPKVSNKVTVKPPGNEPTVEKTVETGPSDTTKENLLINAKNTPFSYKVNVAVPSNVEGYKSIRLEDTLQDVLESTSTQVLVDNNVNNTLTELVKKDIANPNMISLDVPTDSDSTFKSYAGKTITLVINAKIKDSVTIDQIAYKYGNSSIPNNATLVFNGNPKISNEVKVTPPSETPTPVKDVNAQQAIALSNINEEFVYNVRYTVPTNVTGFNNLTMTDELQKVLEIAKNSDSSNKIQVYVDEKLDTNLTNKVDVSMDPATQAQKVTLAIENGFMTSIFGSAFENLAGKTIRVEIKANIKKGADLSSYVNNSVPNKATLSLNGNPKTSTEVTVTPPPGENPPVEKKVNGEDEYVLKNINEEHTYTVKSKVSKNVVGYKKLVLTDELVSILQTTTEPSVEIGGQAVNVSDYGTLTNVNGKVELVIDKNFANIAGKDVVLTIKAKVKENADKAELSKYLTAGSIPNTAKLVFNDNPAVEDSVKVIPPGETPNLDKKVNNEDELILKNIDENLNYTMDIAVPENTRDITRINLTDTFINIFKLQTPTVQVFKDGKEDKDLTDLAQAGLNTNDQTVEFNVDSKEEANKYAGTTIKVTVPVTIDLSKNLGDYLKAGVLPNTAKLVFNNTPQGKIEDTAKVIPPKEEPTPVKDVNGKQSLDLSSLDQLYTYHVKAKVPSNTNDITKFVLTDDLEDILATSKEQVEIKVNGVVDTNLTGKVTVGSGNLVSLDIPMDELASYKGKNIEMSIEARIKEGVTASELDKYSVNPNGSIPNTANLALTDDPEKDLKSNTVPVTPPPGDKPSIEKKVNNENLYILKDLNEEHTYTVKSKVPTNVVGYKKLVLSDQLLDVLEVSGDLTVTIGGQTVNVSDYGTLTNVANKVELTLNKNFVNIAGKDVVLTIKARVKNNANKDSLAKYRTTGGIPNTANLVFNDNPAGEDEVRVIPPGETPPPPTPEDPTPVKDVNDKTGIILNNLNQEFTYHINAIVPKDISEEAPTDKATADGVPTDSRPTDGAPTDNTPTDGAPTDSTPTNGTPLDKATNKVKFTEKYTKYVLIDDLEDVLTTSKDMISVKVDSVVDPSLSENITVGPGNVVSLNIPVEKIDSYKGKHITLVINAKIKDGVTAEELAKYATSPNNISIPNIASLALTNNPSEDKKTEKVTVTPPPEKSGDKPSIEKKVNGEDEYKLKDLYEEHTYTVSSVIPQNVTVYKNVVLSDQLVDVLEVSGEPFVTANGSTIDISKYGELTNVNGKVELVLKKNFDQLAGKKVVLTIKAKVKKDANKTSLNKYIAAGGIPNTAKLVFNDKPAGEDTVKVIPPTPKEPPTPETTQTPPGGTTIVERHTSNTSNDSSSSTKRLVSTGDGRSPYFYGGIATLIGLALIAFGIKTRKDEEKEGVKK